MSKNIAVLGGGILGLTVATVLRVAGFSVRIYSEKEISDAGATNDPLFASAYPAASVIPHTVQAERLDRLVEDSNRVFQQLAEGMHRGVRIQKHYEIAEGGIDTPDYVDALLNFQRCAQSELPVRREGAGSVEGYLFDCFFCDMPTYGPWLQQLVRTLGVEIVRQRVAVDWLRSQNPDFIVNCLGAGAHKVFDDLDPGQIVKGILLLSDMHSEGSDFTSYNYSPACEVYPSFQGDGSSDVYFYQRHDHAILGGTRQRGNLVNGVFIPDEPARCDYIRIGDIDVPAPIIDLNAQLLKQLIGRGPGPILKVLVGYRHLHIDAGGRECVALGLQDRSGIAPVVDCFGFGGAGVTLSWGAALRCANLIAHQEGQKEITLDAILHELKRHSGLGR
ncbi:MAG: FAD-dependent oxidoreductase [Pseudomonadota bacterium]